MMIALSNGQEFSLEESSSRVRSLTSRIYAELRRDILWCRLKPGERLRIGVIQNRFGSSLSAVREALARLASEGLLISRDQRGFSVSPVSATDCMDIFRVRSQIESLAITQAIETADSKWIADVSVAYGEMLRNQDSSTAYWDTDDWVAAHSNFHKSLIGGCGSPILVSISEQLAERSQRYRHLSLMAPLDQSRDGEHKEIFEAVLTLDSERACAALNRHYETTSRILLENIGDILDMISPVADETAA